MYAQTHISQIFLGCDLGGIQLWKNKHLLEVGCVGISKLGRKRRRRRREERRPWKYTAGYSPLSPVVIYQTGQSGAATALPSGAESEETLDCIIAVHDASSINRAL